jgi:hypothetical protein
MADKEGENDPSQRYAISGKIRRNIGFVKSVKKRPILGNVLDGAFGESPYKGGDVGETVTLNLSSADKHLKSGNYSGAIDSLNYAITYLNTEHRSDFPRERYLGAIDRRAARLVRKLKGEKKKDKKVSDEVKRLVDRLSGLEGNVSRQSVGGETVLGAVSIIGIIGGLLFLSTSLTGNTIGNMANSTSNFVGVFLFIVGLIGLVSYFNVR